MDESASVRIIAGQARGRRLVAPKGSDTRPTPDRVREAVFSMLAERTHDAQVLDLFAGTGALGLEAYSRGATQVTLVEKSPAALAALTRNVQAISASGVEIIAGDARRVLSRLEALRRKYTLVFLDPPYALNLLGPMLVALANTNLLLPGCTVVCEHHGRDPAPSPPPEMLFERTRTFGDVAISYFEVKENA